MILEVNGEHNFKIPDIQKHLKDEFDSLNINEIIQKLEDNSSQFKSSNSSIKQMPYLERMKLSSYKFRYLKKITKLYDGASFGELALLMDQPRSATIISTRNSHFATLNRRQFNDILRKVQEGT